MSSTLRPTQLFASASTATFASTLASCLVGLALTSSATAGGDSMPVTGIQVHAMWSSFGDSASQYTSYPDGELWGGSHSHVNSNNGFLGAGFQTWVGSDGSAINELSLSPYLAPVSSGQTVYASASWSVTVLEGFETSASWAGSMPTNGDGTPLFNLYINGEQVTTPLGGVIQDLLAPGEYFIEFNGYVIESWGQNYANLWLNLESHAVPAPGALALLGLAGMTRGRSRRRRS